LTPNADLRPSRVHRRRAKNDIGVTNAIESGPPAASGDTDRKHVDPGYKGSILVPMKKTRPLEGPVAVVARATRGEAKTAFRWTTEPRLAGQRGRKAAGQKFNAGKGGTQE